MRQAQTLIWMDRMLKKSPNPQAADLRPIVLACFGRGGSNLMFSALGSSESVLRMEREWHEAVFDDLAWLRRALRRLSRRGIGLRLGTGSAPPDRTIQTLVRRRVMSDVRPHPIWTDRAPSHLVMKVMDYNIVRIPLIEASFSHGQVVCLTRGPLAQCESLMRSGLPVTTACQWYNDVAHSMANLPAGTIRVRFEDFVKNPLQTLDLVFLSLRLSPCAAFEIKDKAFGQARTKSTDVTHAATRRLARHELRDFVEPDVNARAIARLSDADRAEILHRTTDAAARLGYTGHA